MKKLSHEREHSIMFDSSNEKNLENFTSLLKHFFYTDRTNQRIKEAINPYSLDKKFHFINSHYNLNSQLRSWYKIKATKETDQAYRTYYSIMYNKVPFADFDNIQTYETFKSGKYKGQKLFKFLLKNNLLNKEDVEKITHNKNNSDLYLCISRNPIDFMFASTNQSFSSCISFNSSYDRAYYMALPALTLDPNRCLIFITNGKIKRYTLKGREFKHYGYISRTWSILTDKDKTLVINPYPHESISYSTTLKEYFPISDRINFKSKFSFSRGLFQDHETRAMIYLDAPCGGIKGEYYSYGYNGNLGDTMGFDCGMRFENVTDFDDLNVDGNRNRCYDCGCQVDEDYIFYVYDEYYCENCYNNNFFYCESCEEDREIESNIYIEFENQYVCKDCYNQYYFTCDECGEVFSEDDNSDGLCEHCYLETHAQCNVCGDYFLNDEMVEDKGRYYCVDCEEERKVAA